VASFRCNVLLHSGRFVRTGSRFLSSWMSLISKAFAVDIAFRTLRCPESKHSYVTCEYWSNGKGVEAEDRKPFMGQLGIADLYKIIRPKPIEKRRSSHLLVRKTASHLSTICKAMLRSRYGEEECPLCCHENCYETDEGQVQNEIRRNGLLQGS